MIIVDVSNVIQTSGILPPDLAGLDVDDLAALVLQSRYRAAGGTLVCDGSGQSRALGVFRIIWSGPGRSADDAIGDLIAQNSAPRRITVISTDKAVRRSAGRRRCKVLTSQEFLLQLLRDRQRPEPPPVAPFTQEIPLDSLSLAAWLREFGMPAEADALERDRRPAARLSASGGRALPAHPPAPPHPPGTSPIKTEPTRASTGPSLPKPIDPLLLDALEHWAGRISLDDLDMERWLRSSDPPAR